MTQKATGAVQRALISVYNKDNLAQLARGLHAKGVQILASGGTAKAIEQADVPVTRVEVFTGAKEVLGGRVKTLHPKVHAGILADRRHDEHMADLAANDFVPIDLVVCNLYPFEEALAQGVDHDAQVEKIDIGGPTLLRAAAKNADGGVSVLCDPSQYDDFLAALGEGTGVPLALRRKLAATAFKRVCDYDVAITEWTAKLAGGVATPAGAAAESTGALPDELPAFHKTRTLRYGENPHQQAALYVEAGATHGVALGEQLAGKELSYNNYLDLDAGYRAACFGDSAQHRCAVMKHTNPCGLAVRDDQAEAFRRALAGDPMSAFGSIIGFNKPLTREAAEAIKESKLFVECIVAPGFDAGAREVFAKRQNLRLVRMPAGDPTPTFHGHRIGGGMLVQSVDPGLSDPKEWRCVTKKQLEDGWLDQLVFGMDAVALLKSNAVCLVHDWSLLGAGAGQMSRVDAAEQAIKKAGDRSRGSFMASDAFFPFDDCVRLAHEAGVVAIVQPGGSKRDQDSIDACDQLGLAMLFTGRRHFRH